jgi:hypothetical protein
VDKNTLKTETMEDYGYKKKSLPEEPASEDLEEEITKCYKSRNDLMMTREQFGKIIRHFTEWQKQQIMKKDLELTFEDIKYLDELILYVYRKENLRDDELYKEVLKRFKARYDKCCLENLI